jgi:hypothetical protein
MRRLVPIHMATNALLLWLVYYWLGIGESRAFTLLWSFTVALAILALLSATYGAALVYFRTGKAPWRTAIANLLPLVTATVGALCIYFLLAKWTDYNPTPATKVASYLTLEFRKPVRPASTLAIFNAVVWLVRWMILPVMLLPMIAAIAVSGWRGFRAFGSYGRRWIYWVEAPLLLLCALWLPMKLLGWVPHAGGFGWEMVSFLARATVAYLLFIAAGLLLAFVSSGGKPPLTQPKTAVSP